MPLRFYELAEAEHRILNPFDDERLMLLGEICRLREGQELLDLACGKGEMLGRWAQAWGSIGTGVDLSEVFIAAARARAAALGVDDLVHLHHGEAAEYVRTAGDARYDVVSCIGATWIGGGLQGTLDLLAPRLREDGLLLVGEPYWLTEPTEEDCRVVGVAPEDYATLVGTLERFEAAGRTLVEMVLADQDSWDRYQASQWWTMDRWLRSHPDDPDAETFRARIDKERRAYLSHGRARFGWGVFVLR